MGTNTGFKSLASVHDKIKLCGKEPSPWKILQFITFSFGGKTLTFRTCDGLEKYIKVLTWDDGYLEVLAKYKQEDKEIEESIDLEPVLKRLYMDKASFIRPIKSVRIEYV